MVVRRIFGLVVALALLGAAGVVALGGFAAADSPSDGRAVFHDGNATTCAQVGFGSSTQTEGDANVTAVVSNHAGGGEELNVTVVGAITIDAIVVKGGNGYNVYSSAVPSMISPFNNGNQIPSISHFFICYHEGTTPETPTTTTTTTTAAPQEVSAGTVTVQPTFTG